MAKKSAGYSEEFSADDQKAMNDMRTADATLPEPENIPESAPESVSPSPEAPETVIETPESKDQNKMVPHAALHEEREARKAADKRSTEATEARIRAEERMNLLIQASQPKPVEKQSMPDPDKDALGALKYATQQLTDLQQQNERFTQQQQQQEVSRIAQQAAYQEQQFTAITPDYQDASGFLLNSRARELEAFGASPQQIQQQIEMEKFQLAQQALQSGRNPAEMVYTMAKLRGYAAKVAPVTQDNIDRISQGQKANTSLSNINGTSVNTKGLSGADIAKLPEDEFQKLMASMTKAQQRAAFGD